MPQLRPLNINPDATTHEYPFDYVTATEVLMSRGNITLAELREHLTRVTCPASYARACDIWAVMTARRKAEEADDRQPD